MLNEPIYVTLKDIKLKTDEADNSGVLDEIVIFILVYINTEEELSYIDRNLYECEFKMVAEDYLDQREK